MNTSSENAANRNFIRNLLAKAANRNAQGQQRIVTSKDALAYGEHLDMYGCCNVDSSDSDSQFGFSTSGE